ncbi:hypothetical protein ACKWTF_008368 [Chironomus riparius]
MSKNKLIKAAKSTKNIADFLNRDIENQALTQTHQNIADEDVFTVDDVQNELTIDIINKPKVISAKDLESSVNSLTNNGDVKSAMSMILKAYTSLAEAVEKNFENCANIAQAVDNTHTACQETSEELNEEIFKVSKKHEEYVDANENDKQQLKLKTDIRHYKTQMIIYLKNDKILNSCNGNDCIALTEKIIKEQGLSLGRAYVAKAIILSGMKRINNFNKFTKYIYVHFSDSFTSERLIMEMISKNKKSSNKSNPDAIFTQPSSYDVNKIKRICHELQSDKAVSKVFIGDDSIKVTLNKADPSDLNEKPKKIHVRNFSDLDKLRANITANNHHIPSRTFYNKDYWQKKYPRDTLSKRKADDSMELDDPKKQKFLSNRSSLQKVNKVITCDDTLNTASTSTSDTDM